MLFLLSLAYASDVIWLGDLPDAQKAAVLEASGGKEIEAVALRAAATDLTDRDVQALRGLGAALETVRPYETQLDGELLILRDLQRPVELVGLLRDETDRNALFAALAYQGFAVDRYFGERIATDEEASAYRTEIAGTLVATPWLDAVALDPERRVSPYDIAEAPQRVHYAQIQQVVQEQLPASLVLGTLPKGSTLTVDGRPTSADATGSIKLPPGRHLIHASVGGSIIARWDLRLQSGSESTLDVALTDEIWTAFIGGLAEGAAVPEAIQPSLEAMGEVWFASANSKGPTVWAVTSSSVRSIAVEMAKPEKTGGDTSFGVQAAVLGGWTGSQDFYYQNPLTEPSTGTVNAASLGASAGIVLPIGPLRLAAGADVILPLGADHIAITGANSMRVRPIPHVAAGIRPVQAAVGYLFPYHPAVGLRGAVPVLGPIELRWLGWFGIPSTKQRDGAAAYESKPVGMAAAGVGIRI